MALDSKENVLWFFAGVSAGVAIALLCAPQSGQETRRLLNETGHQWADRGRRLAGSASDLLEQGRKLVEIPESGGVGA
jgi:gas vesicle protein